MKILVLNAGSSSQKSHLYEIAGDALPTDPPKPLWKAQIESGDNSAKLTVEANGKKREEKLPDLSRPDAIKKMLQTLLDGETKAISRFEEVDVIGHRVVHGGREHTESTRINSEVKTTIQQLVELAPAHNPAALDGVAVVESLFGGTPQVAAFDTAFHSHLPNAAATYPGPYEWWEQGIRRYGFHGINHQYCMERAAQILKRNPADLRLITCHLGNGCSLAAIQNGRSMDTTMGFTPMDGLMMGNRSGSVDPGILLYLLRHKGQTPDGIDKLLNQGSGLKGISGISGDLRQINEAIQSGNNRARLALDMYIHVLRRFIGAMAAVLGGVDALVFTAGVGEHSATVRAGACANLGFMGVQIDGSKNENPAEDSDISTLESPVRVLVITAQEDWSIAKDCWRIVRTEGQDHLNR